MSSETHPCHVDVSAVMLIFSRAGAPYSLPVRARLLPLLCVDQTMHDMSLALACKDAHRYRRHPPS